MRVSKSSKLPWKPGVPTEFAVRFLARFVYPVARAVHRATWEGVEKLPIDKPYLLVGNHPPGLGIGEFFPLMALWTREFGRTRPLAAFAHHTAHRVWPFPWFLRHIGAIPSTYEAAEETLAQGVPIMLFPGGDHEGFKPFWKKGVDFNGRAGFLRIARKADIPIVPFAITGESSPILLRSRALAWIAIVPRVMGIKRWGITVLGALGAVPLLTLLPVPLPLRLAATWLWVFSPLSLMPWVPSKTHIQFGAPMPPTATTEEVQAAIDDLLRIANGSFGEAGVALAQ
jgi:1-acyl-sn-glycerol-3-phosphate acyltransferase